MSALVWLLIPVVATIGASIYVVWKARDRGPAKPETSMGDYQRFKSAFDKDNS
jgi:hypothetical protein